MLRLYDYAASANCLKARLVLRQLGIDYERVPIDIFAGENDEPRFRALNPAGRVPVIGSTTTPLFPNRTRSCST